MTARAHRLRSLTCLTAAATLAVLLSGCQGGNEPGQQPSSPSSSATPTGTPTPTTPPLKTGIVKGKNGWSSYTNAELGFQLRIPTRIYVMNGSPCTKENEGSSDFSYRPAAGVVPATVVRDGDWFYVTQKYGYQLGNPHTRNGVTLFGSCTKTATTVKVVRSYESLDSDYSLSILPVLVTTAASRAQVQTVLGNEYFQCDSVVVTALTAPTATGRRDVSFECETDPMFFNGMVDARLYTNEHLFALFSFGQAIQILDDHQNPADSLIAKSFKPVS